MKHGTEWERPGWVSFFENGRLVYSTGVGVRVHGGSSRELPRAAGFPLVLPAEVQRHAAARRDRVRAVAWPSPAPAHPAQRPAHRARSRALASGQPARLRHRDGGRGDCLADPSGPLPAQRRVPGCVRAGGALPPSRLLRGAPWLPRQPELRRVQSDVAPGARDAADPDGGGRAPGRPRQPHAVVHRHACSARPTTRIRAPASFAIRCASRRSGSG